MGVPSLARSGPHGAAQLDRAATIGTQAAAFSPPDGTTFLMVFDTHGVNPSLQPNLPFDTLKDLTPIMLIGKSPMVVTAHPAAVYTS